MVELIWLGRELIGLRGRGDPLIDQVLFNQILQEVLLVARSYLRDCATSSDFFISPEMGWSSRLAIAIRSGCVYQKGMQRG